MIPCLYDSKEMTFDHNGIGKLADAQSCTVTEKRNGSYELKLVCPADGIHAERLEEGNIILAKSSDTGQSQPFRIYKVTTPIDGKIYTVVPGDNLWKIAERELGSGSRCADLRVLNGLTSNAIRVGMKLLIP